MNDLGLLFISALAVATLSVLLAHGLGAWKAGWSRRRLALLSAAPVPLLILLLAGFTFVRALTATREQCGVDACGFAMAGAAMLGLVAAFLFLLSAGIVYLVRGGRGQ